ncbi:DUF2157 domain-containing protein [Kribbella sp. NBC_00889]|uniref:DUF2157 domain-containing protein n=1 Tax=Kribbella sp. NBC_00889 TaxID=2975974 RepID=UPI00386D98F4|nr:DUF2157 domain-containing protein [Kribbella sp. NBC_00889]
MRHSSVQPPADLPALLEHWIAAGVITPEQAARMRADVGPSMPPASPETEHRQASLAIEALGYLGSVLIVVASLLLASEYWDDLSTVGQLIIIGGAAGTLLLAGFVVPERLGRAGTRMHAVLWLGATVATAGLLGLFGDEVLGWYDEDLALLVFVGVTALAAALWWRLPTALQQAAVVAGLAGAAGAAAAEFHARADQLPGLAIWGVGAIWFVLGWGGIVLPRWTALLLGGFGLMIGSGMTMPADGGIVVALTTVTALVVLAVLARDLLVLALGAWGALQFLPIAINEWFPGEVAAAIALLVAGGLLVSVAIWIARRRGVTPQTGVVRRDYGVIPAEIARVASVAVAVAVTTAIIVLGIT